MPAGKGVAIDANQTEGDHVISYDEKKPSRMNAGGRFSSEFLKNKGVFRRRLTQTPLPTIFPSLEKIFICFDGYVIR